jgi:hypothetical protein
VRAGKERKHPPEGVRGNETEGATQTKAREWPRGHKGVKGTLKENVDYLADELFGVGLLVGGFGHLGVCWLGCWLLVVCWMVRVVRVVFYVNQRNCYLPGDIAFINPAVDLGVVLPRELASRSSRSAGRECQGGTSGEGRIGSDQYRCPLILPRLIIPAH